MNDLTMVLDELDDWSAGDGTEGRFHDLPADDVRGVNQERDENGMPSDDMFDQLEDDA